MDGLAKANKVPPSDSPAPALTVDGAVTAALDKIGTTRATWMIMILVVLGVFFDVFEEGALGAAGPALMNSLGISALELTALQTVTIGAMIAGKFVTGVLGDRYGRRFTLSMNLIVYCVGALVCAVSPNYEVLVIGRLIVGFGLGGEIPAALRLLSEMVSTRHRGSFTAAVNVGGGGLGNPAAFGFAALILGPLSDLFGGEDNSWRFLFGLLIIPAAMVVFYRRYLPESPRFLANQGRFEEANIVFARLKSGRLRGPLTEIYNYFPDNLVATVKEARPRLRDLVEGPLLRRTVSLSVVSWMTFGAQISVLLLMPIVLIDKGYGITDSLVFTMLMNVGSLIGALLATYGASRWPRKVVMVVTSILGLVTALMFGLVADGTVSILIFGTAFHLCLMLLNTTIFAWTPELYPTRIRAFGTAIIALQGNVGGALFPLVAAVVLTNYGVSGMFITIAAVFIVLIVAVLFAPETQGKTLEEINVGL